MVTTQEVLPIYKMQLLEIISKKHTMTVSVYVAKFWQLHETKIPLKFVIKFLITALGTFKPF